MKKLTTEEFIQKSIKIHGDKYDYSKVNYTNARTKVKIICPIHGTFEQIPSSHTRGIECKKCGDIKIGNKLRMTTEEFIIKSKNIWKDEYSYNLVKYKNNYTKITIMHNKCGNLFQMRPWHHLAGRGCRFCMSSKGEFKIENWLNENKIKYQKQKWFKECRNKKPLPFDFYLPDYNTLIEYDGEQHFKSISRWGGEENFKKTQNNDKIKTRFAENNNIKLLRIPYTKSNDIEKILNHQWS